jgi:hypothetical protein
MSSATGRFSIFFAFSAISLLQGASSAIAQEPILAPKTPQWMVSANTNAENTPTTSAAATAPGLIEVYGRQNSAASPTTTCDTNCPSQNCFSYKIVLYGWVPGCNGHLTVRDRTARVDLSIAHSWDLLIYDLDFVAIGQIEVNYGNFGMIFNGVYDKESPGTTIGHLNFNGGLKTTLLDWLATYNLEGIATSLGLPSATRFELLAGVRYYALAASLTLSEDRPPFRTISVGGSKEWTDPIVGFRVRLPICDVMTAQFRGDVGGFDLPQASKFSWNIEATLEYSLSDRCSLLGGWRWLDVDRQRGSGISHFGFDALMSGPLAGLTIKF